MSLLLSDFDFELPERLIARYPARPRDAARLLVVRPDRLEDRRVGELPAILRPGDLMVFNDTKVIPAQLQGRRARAGSPEVAVEVTLHKRAGDDRWQAFAKPGRRLAPGDRILFGEDLAAEVLEKSPAGDILLGFDRGGPELMAALHRKGAMPLPPYIRKLRPVEAADAEDYQTVYAGPEGAVAAPTAGLHFTPGLLAAVDGARDRARDRDPACGRRHLPAGQDRAHRGASHACRIWRDPAGRRRGHQPGEGRGPADRRRRHHLAPAAGIRRQRGWARSAPSPARPRSSSPRAIASALVDLLMTNFHLPKSTLFMLVAAFAGLERMKQAYAHAIAADYRFFSYGDASLLERAA